MTLRNDRYTYRVAWSEEDNEHVGLCAEFPGLSWLARTPEAALRGIRKFVVRVPPEVHRRLATEAAEEGVSLNRLANAKLNR
jgi:hypothetical protein